MSKGSKERVLEVWPKASAKVWGGWREMEQGFTVWTGEYRNDKAIGGGETEDEAWDDAASRWSKEMI